MAEDKISLSQLYKQHEYPAKSTFIKIAREHGYMPSATKQYLEGRTEQELFAKGKPPVGKYNYNGYDICLQMDLSDVSKYSRLNNGYNWILNIIEARSRYAFSFPLKQKTPSEIKPHVVSVIEGLGDIAYWKKLDVPVGLLFIRVITDQGSEFKGEVKAYLKSHENISRLETIPGKRKSTNIVERFNYTVLSAMRRVFVATGKEVWTRSLPGIIKSYNNRVHSETGRKPVEMYNAGTPAIIDMDNVPTRRFVVGDLVRVIKARETFEKKGARLPLSLEIYSVVEYLPGGKVQISNNDVKRVVLESEIMPAKEES